MNSGRAKPRAQNPAKIVPTGLAGMGLGLSLTGPPGRGFRDQSRASAELKPSIPGAKFELRQHGRAYFNLIEKIAHPTGFPGLLAP